MSRYMLCAIAWSGALMSVTFAAPAQSETVPVTVGTPAPAGDYVLNVICGSVVVNAVLTADSTGHATGISGFVNDTDPITGLSIYAGADNNVYATGAWVTFGGLSFSTTSLGDFNFYNSGLGYYGLLNSITDINGYPDGAIATAQVAPVPEPSTWIMMLFGLGAGGAALRRTRATGLLPQLA